MKNKLTVIIGSCDTYNPHWKNFNILYKKYWNLETRNIFVGETIPFPYENFENILPGLNHPWGFRILEALKEVKTEYVCLMLEDYYLTETISEQFINEHINILEKYSAQKIMFDVLNFPCFYTLKQIENDLFLFDKTSEYLNSIQPAIWKTDYLKQVLFPHYSPWNFEVEGNSFSSTLNPTILIKTRKQQIYFNFCRKGGYLSEGWKELLIKEDIIKKENS